MEINYIIIVLCLVFLSFLLVKEAKRADRSRLLWRIVANVFMVVSFALLIIPITYSIKKIEPSHELNLLTEGTPLDTILALKSAKYDLDSSLFPERKNLKISHLSDLTYHLKVHPEIKKINVYGYGLTTEQLKKLKGYILSFHPSESPSGITSVSWPKKMKATEPLLVQGSYHNPSDKAVKLVLSGFGTGLDSLKIKANAKTNFSLSTQPKQIGKAVFQLVTLHGRDTLNAEPIPFVVLPKSPIRVLILASFPDFEYKFLKKWLYENQYSVAFRSRISKDKYATEFLNRKAVNLGQINRALLKEIDLIVADEGELNPELMRAVSNGMGLIVRAKSIKKTKGHQWLLTDTSGKITVDSHLNGMGKIVTTTLSSTYEWQLAGKQAEYGRFWSQLFSKAVRKKIDSSSFSTVSNWPTVNERVRGTTSIGTDKPPLILFENAFLAPRQNMELPFRWDTYFWPKTSGWMNISINQNVEAMYSYKKTDWKAAKNSEKLRATTNFSTNTSTTEIETAKIEYSSAESLNKLWLFLIFIVAISFLWYEQRFLAYN